MEDYKRKTGLQTFVKNKGSVAKANYTSRSALRSVALVTFDVSLSLLRRCSGGVLDRCDWEETPSTAFIRSV